jgi:hypothetical protein
MKITDFEDGLDIFIQNEELSEMYRIVHGSSMKCDLKYKLLSKLECRLSIKEV